MSIIDINPLAAVFKRFSLKDEIEMHCNHDVKNVCIYFKIVIFDKQKKSLKNHKKKIHQVYRLKILLQCL